MPIRHRSKIGWLVALSIVVADTLLGAGVADAVPAQCSGSGGFEGYNGYTSGQPNSAHNTARGTSADIVTQNPGLCTINSAGVFSMIWVMMADTDTLGLVQAGEVHETPYGCIKDFYEYHKNRSSGTIGNGDGGRVLNNACLADGQTRRYRVLIQGTTANPVINAYWGNPGGTMNLVYSAPGAISTWTILPWTHIVPEYDAETDNDGANIPGSASAPALMQSMGILAGDGAGLIPTPCYLTSIQTAPRGHLAASGCQNFSVWSDQP